VYQRRPVYIHKEQFSSKAFEQPIRNLGSSQQLSLLGPESISVKCPAPFDLFGQIYPHHHRKGKGRLAKAKEMTILWSEGIPGWDVHVVSPLVEVEVFLASCSHFGPFYLYHRCAWPAFDPSPPLVLSAAVPTLSPFVPKYLAAQPSDPA